MPVWGIVGLAVAGLVALGGIGTVIDAVVSDGPAATASASPSAAVAVPEYKVVKTRRNAVDLLVPKATVASAQAAIHDWLEQNADGHDYLSVMVVRSANAKTYVCSAEYVADERTSQIKTGGRITADEYPATVMNCPDPGGS